MQITGTIVRQPIVKNNIIFTSIKEEKNNPIQVVLFTKYRPAKLINLLSNAKIDDKVTIVGRLETNPYNNETQIVIDDLMPSQSNESNQYEDIPCPMEF